MMIDVIYAQFASDRQRELRAAADAYRLARQARAPAPGRRRVRRAAAPAGREAVGPTEPVVAG